MTDREERRAAAIERCWKVLRGYVEPYAERNIAAAVLDASGLLDAECQQYDPTSITVLGSGGKFPSDEERTAIWRERAERGEPT